MATNPTSEFIIVRLWRRASVAKRITSAFAAVLCTIANSATTQQTRAHDCSAALRQINMVTHENAAAAEQSAAAAEELNAQAQVLRKHIIDLMKVVDGDHGQDSELKEAAQHFVAHPAVQSPKDGALGNIGGGAGTPKIAIGEPRSFGLTGRAPSLPAASSVNASNSRPAVGAGDFEEFFN